MIISIMIIMKADRIHIQLSAGTVHDVKVAQEMLEAVKLRPGMTVLADSAYGKWELREYIANHGADFCIPSKSNKSGPWFVDRWLYKERHLEETFSLKLEECCRVATRYVKLADCFLTSIHLACMCILLA